MPNGVSKCLNPPTSLLSYRKCKEFIINANSDFESILTGLNTWEKEAPLVCFRLRYIQSRVSEAEQSRGMYEEEVLGVSSAGV